MSSMLVLVSMPLQAAATDSAPIWGGGHVWLQNSRQYRVHWLAANHGDHQRCAVCRTIRSRWCQHVCCELHSVGIICMPPHFDGGSRCIAVAIWRHPLSESTVYSGTHLWTSAPGSLKQPRSPLATSYFLSRQHRFQEHRELPYGGQELCRALLWRHRPRR